MGVVLPKAAPEADGCTIGNVPDGENPEADAFTIAAVPDGNCVAEFRGTIVVVVFMTKASSPGVDSFPAQA